MIDSPFDEITATSLYEKLTDQEQYIVGWKSGMHGPPKTSKTLAKELSLEVKKIDEIYQKSINFIKINLEQWT